MPLAAVMVVLFSACAALTLLIALVYAGGILPRVSAGGIDLGGMSQAEAVRALSAWDEIVLTDGENEWPVNPGLYGVSLDAEATAREAYAQGRSEGSPFQSILGRTHIDPVVQVDLVTAAVTFEEMAPRFETPAVNAGVTMDDGQVRPTAPQDGRRLDVAALIGLLERDASALLADGVLELPMQRVQPEVSDSSPLVARATELLANPLLIEAYDPIQNTADYWSAMPQDWGRWLSAAPDATSPIGLSLALNNGPLSDYLSQQSANLGGGRYLNVEDAAAMIQGVVAQGRTDTMVRVYHGDMQHVVQPGETIMSIAWDYGLPYLYISRANPGMGDFVSAGQTITIPSADNMLEFPLVFNKRIVVNMSQQRTRVYENGQLKWDWIASTGIADSPTWPGVYQVLLHDPNAYAANWNLYMPWFIGVYRPVPDAAFTNGFHGFPTRGGSQLLWTNSLGTRVTYGCILLSSDNAKLLYDWAEEGIVVEIQP